MLFDRAVFYSVFMTTCVCLLGCITATAPRTVFKPIEPVPAATVEHVAIDSVPLDLVQDAAPKIEPTIIMHSASFSCPPCEMWIRNSMPSWKKEGWTIPEPLKESVSGQSYPWFEIIDADGLRFQVVGQLTRATYENERKKALGKK